MKKTNVTISFDEEKLAALRLYMEQKGLQLIVYTKGGYRILGKTCKDSIEP